MNLNLIKKLIRNCETQVFSHTKSVSLTFFDNSVLMSCTSSMIMSWNPWAFLPLTRSTMKECKKFLCSSHVSPSVVLTPKNLNIILMWNVIHLNKCIKFTSFSFLIEGSGKHVWTAIEFFTFKSFFNHLPGIQYDDGLSSKENTENVAILLAQSFTTSTNIFHVYEWNMAKQWNSNWTWKKLRF